MFDDWSLGKIGGPADFPVLDISHKDMAFSLIKGHLEMDFLTSDIVILIPATIDLHLGYPKWCHQTWQTIHHQTC